MARAPDPKAAQAKEMFLAGKKLIEIAEALGVPEGTVRSWKNRYGWNCNINATLQSKQLQSKRNVAKKRGGQPGNKNAVGHGGTGPPGNKNAVTTGEFETLLFDCLDPEERRLADAVPADKGQLLLQEIRLLTVREHRMLRRIEDLRRTEEYYDSGELAAGMTMVSRKSGIEKGHETDLKEFQGKLGQIQAIEDALTRVQGRKQRAIEALHKFGFDDARLEIELTKVELATLKIGGQETEEEDDGFLDALNAQAGDLWGDADDNS